MSLINLIYCFNLTACQDGDVKLDNNSPKLYKDGNWHSLCGDCRQVTNSGAKKFCIELGYKSGKILETNQTVPLNGTNQNIANVNDTLVIESSCSSLNSTSRLEEKGICERGTDAIEIECLDSTSLFKNQTSSC